MSETSASDAVIAKAQQCVKRVWAMSVQSEAWSSPEDAETRKAVVRWTIAMVCGMKAMLWRRRDLTRDLKVDNLVTDLLLMMINCEKPR